MSYSRAEGDTRETLSLKRQRPNAGSAVMPSDHHDQETVGPSR